MSDGKGFPWKRPILHGKSLLREAQTLSLPLTPLGPTLYRRTHDKMALIIQHAYIYYVYMSSAYRSRNNSH